MKTVRRLLWAAVAVAAVALYAGHRLNAAERTERGALGRVPAFSLLDQRGKTVTDGDLRGAPWVANFVFTRCPSACPLLSAKFKSLQAQVQRPDLRFVSISVDPAHDTPPVLAEYAARFGADPRRWLFLTGPLAEIEKTVVEGFKIHMGEPTPSENDPNLIDIMHGEHFVLVDGQGVIRGYYRADAAGLEELKSDLARL
jgi:protein SCO1/2